MGSGEGVFVFLGGVGENPDFFQKRVAKFRPVLIFLGSVSSQACLLGYTFNGPVQNCCQLSRNLPWEARHFFATLQIKKKKKTLAATHTPGPPSVFFFNFVV
jgi:hypothetical protein